ncbi:hypothetical protein DFJ77DRAFT_514421 [Powellomyces hirtus]|nr:hypothetical protein DFJ77DRAFT_514421 [Powellomyces hirtus]
MVSASATATSTPEPRSPSSNPIPGALKTGQSTRGSSKLHHPDGINVQQQRYANHYGRTQPFVAEVNAIRAAADAAITYVACRKHHNTRFFSTVAPAARREYTGVTPPTSYNCFTNTMCSATRTGSTRRIFNPCLQAFTEEFKDDERRFVGLIVIPAAHLTNVEVEAAATHLSCKDGFPHTHTNEAAKKDLVDVWDLDFWDEYEVDEEDGFVKCYGQGTGRGAI